MRRSISLADQAVGIFPARGLAVADMNRPEGEHLRQRRKIAPSALICLQ